MYIIQMKILFGLMLFGCFMSVNAESTWNLEKIKNNIHLYSMQDPSYELKHFKAETQINKDADTILAALQDTAACADWVYNCVSNDMVDMTDVRKRIYHTVIHAPLWFKDRDFYLQSHVIYDPSEKLFTIKLISKPAYDKEANDKVRVTQVEMVWWLRYLADDITAVTYQVYIDPKLPMKSINHAMIEKSVYQTMLGLTQLVKKPAYAITKYSESELEMLTAED